MSHLSTKKHGTSFARLSIDGTPAPQLGFDETMLRPDQQPLPHAADAKNSVAAWSVRKTRLRVTGHNERHRGAQALQTSRYTPKGFQIHQRVERHTTAPQESALLTVR